MEFYAGLKIYLGTVSAITSLISTRVHPLIIPQNETLPAVAYQDISNDRQHALQQDSDYNLKSVEFSIYGLTYISVKAVAKQFKLALENYNFDDDGLLGGVGGVNVDAVLIQGEFDGFDEESKEFYVKIEFQFFINGE